MLCLNTLQVLKAFSVSLLSLVPLVSLLPFLSFFKDTFCCSRDTYRANIVSLVAHPFFPFKRIKNVGLYPFLRMLCTKKNTKSAFEEILTRKQQQQGILYSHDTDKLAFFQQQQGILYSHDTDFLINFFCLKKIG